MDVPRTKSPSFRTWSDDSCAILESENIGSPFSSSPLIIPSEAFSSGSLFTNSSPSFFTEQMASSFASSPLVEFEPFSKTLNQPFELKPIQIDEDVHVPQPLERLQGSPVPPFLSKTFDLVDDSSLDPIISWGSTGRSFVVWDPLEFSRMVLPRNFKHNNFSSFVRQLNTYGFRKIDADKWEFANEGFQRGKRHLLKDIQRRKSPQAQHVGSYLGPSTEAGKSGLEGEIGRLIKEKNLLMQEVIELQQQHGGTVHHMEAVNQRIQVAEQRQKQMISFLAKLFQKPAFLARLRQIKEQRDIASLKSKKRFFKLQQHGVAGPSTEGQIVKYKPSIVNLPTTLALPDFSPISPEELPDHVLQDIVGKWGASMENVASEKVAIADELADAQEFVKTQEVGEGEPSFGTHDLLFKGKNVISLQQEVTPDHFVSFPENLAKEEKFPEFSSPGIESISKQEDIWSMGFHDISGMSRSNNEVWGNMMNYDVPEFGVTSGLSDFWDLGSLKGPGGSGIDMWPSDESPFDELRSQADQPKNDISKNMDS